MPYLHQTQLESEKSHYMDFLRYHYANPEVYKLAVEFAREAKASGAKTYGIGAIFELIRWNFQIKQKMGDFKLDNNHRSHYARFIMKHEPDLAGFFETRALRSD